MAKSSDALTQLQDQIEAVRREAFAAGYAAAMEAVREVASRPSPGSEGAAAPTPARRGRRPGRPAQTEKEQPARAARASRGTGQRGRRRASTGSRPQRGTNARLVEEVLQSLGGEARPADIRNALQRDKGVSMAFTSIRHALGQLEGRKAVVQSADSKSWR